MNVSIKALLLSVMIVGAATSCSGTVQTPATSAIDAQSTQAPTSTSSAADTKAPAVSMVMYPQTLKAEGYVYFRLSTQDNVGVAKVVLSIDGQPFVDDKTAYNSYAKYFASSDNGAHSVTVKVYDAAQNVTEYKQDFQVDIAH